MTVAIRQEIEQAAYRPWKHLQSAGMAGAFAKLQITATETFFKVAWFYGIKGVPTDGSAAATSNTGDVYVGQKDPTAPTEFYLVDLVSPGEAMKVEAPEGGKLNLAEFYVTGNTAADRVFVKYH